MGQAERDPLKAQQLLLRAADGVVDALTAGAHQLRDLGKAVVLVAVEVEALALLLREQVAIAVKKLRQRRFIHLHARDPPCVKAIPLTARTV